MTSTGVIEVTTDRRGEVVMAPGRYTLRLRTERAVFEGSTVVKSGQTQQIRRNQLSVVPYGRTVRKGYRENQNAVFGVIVGGVATGAVTDGFGPNFGAVLGVRADFKPLSLEVRARGSLANSGNLDLDINQRALGVDLTVLKLYDPGYLSLGFGFRTAVDWVEQRFDTRGQAPGRSSVVGRAAPVLRIEKAIGANTSIIGSAFVDGALINRPGGRELVALPGGEIGLTVVFQ